MKTALTIAAMITFTVTANLLLKTGAVLGREAGGAWWEQLLNWRIVAAFAAFAVAVLFYTLVLRDVPLNVAQSFTAAQFVAIVLASALVLDEPITGMRWAGMAMIACGIAIVGWSQA
ncbi:MAG TPA: EamA family transporter [Usitatibacter sp.]|jgi:multidrug transporter EmrE-like cation transporter|nr:EamA family transporter [Usitatibacter sp.]